MAKTETKNDLVMLNIGWYGKYVMPVDAATQIICLLVKSGAVKVDSESISGRSVLYPTKPEFGVDPLREPYLSDCPQDEESRKDYFAWLKTKVELLGKGYVFESYAEYLKAKE